MVDLEEEKNNPGIRCDRLVGRSLNGTGNAVGRQDGASDTTLLQRYDVTSLKNDNCLEFSGDNKNNILEKLMFANTFISYISFDSF